jgi:predicted phosphodiesterase
MQRNYRSVLAVLYDIHGNLPALEAVLADARAQGAKSFFLGGDYTGFGPFPRETLAALDAIREPTVWIRGNGERWQRELPLDRPEVIASMRSRPDNLGIVDQDTIERLYRLPPRAEVDGVVYVHGCWLTDVDSFAVEPQDADVMRCGPLTGRTLVFGHSHLQFRRPGPNGNELVNPGSVGMPLDRDTRAAWASWDGSDFAFHRTEYDVERSVAAASGMGEWGALIVQRYMKASD